MSNNDGYTLTPPLVCLVEVLLRLTALENLLIHKGLATNAEIQEQFKASALRLADLLNLSSEPHLLTQSAQAEVIGKKQKDEETEIMDLLKHFSLMPQKISKDN